MNDRPSWSCDAYDWPEHDWLNCYECLRGYQKFLGRSESDEHIIIWPVDENPDLGV